MDPTPPTRASLLLRIQGSGDGEAWKQFVGIYTPLIYGTLRRRGLQRADAADVTQEVLQTVAGKVSEFRAACGQGSFRSWLVAVVRNKQADYLRKQQRQVAGSGDTDMLRLLEAQAAADDEQAAFELEYRRHLLAWAAGQVRDHFQPKTWQAFWQTNVEGKTTQEVAEALGMSRGAVYVARSRVLAQIKALAEKVEEAI